MKRIVEISEYASIIMTKGENGYDEVLEDFKSCNEIIIVTYNLASADSGLMSALTGVTTRETPPRIRLVTNIPARWDSYRGPYPRKRYRDMLSSYLSCLDAASMPKTLEAYFNFNNHSKIVATENIAYVGSANYSERSQDNWECGSLLSDPIVIEQLFEAIEEIIEASQEHFGVKYLEIIKEMQSLSARLLIEGSEIEECSISYDDYGRKIGFIASEVQISPDQVKSIRRLLLDMGRFLKQFKEENAGDLAKIVKPIYTIVVHSWNLCATDSDLWKFVDFDDQKVFDRFVSDLSEEGVVSADACYDIATNRVIELRKGLAHAAKPSIERLGASLARLSQMLAALPGQIIRLRKRLDNT